MANGHVEINDPFCNQNGHAGSKDHKSTSDTDSMEDTVELRLLMAYATRRRTTDESPAPDTLVNGGTDANESSSPQTPDKPEKGVTKSGRRKRKGLKRLRSLFSCISSRKGDDEPYQINQKPNDDNRCGDFTPKVTEEEDMKKLASKLTKLADEIQFLPPEVETDSPEDVNVEKMIGLLLRESGDQLNERELKNANIAAELFLNYSFFKLLMSTLLTRMGLKSPNPESPGPKASTETQIAVTCEVTSRLSAVNTLPRNRLMDHGARYLKHYYSSWATQQGGYEGAFYSDDEDDDQ